MGDCNFDYWSMGRNQRQLAPIHDMLVDNVISSGWFHITKENARYQGDQKLCHDHIYTKSIADKTTVHDSNVTAYDHKLIGVTLNVSKNILNPESSIIEKLKVQA